MDGITAFLTGRNEELGELAEKVVKKLQREVEAKGLKLSITEGGKEGKSNVVASSRFLEERFQECSKKDGVVVATSVEALEVDLRTRTKHLGAKAKSRRKKCEVTFSLIRKNKIFQKGYMRTGESC